MKWTEEMELTKSKAMISFVNEDENLIINLNGNWKWNAKSISKIRLTDI